MGDRRTSSRVRLAALSPARSGPYRNGKSYRTWFVRGHGSAVRDRAKIEYVSNERLFLAGHWAQ